MKTYDGILILEPEDTYLTLTPSRGNSLSIRGGSKPLYEATMAIAKKSDGWMFCLKSRERDHNSYSQAELREIVDRYENPVDERIILLNC